MLGSRMGFRASTVQSTAIKLLVESLKDVLNETNLTFDASGMRITTTDVNRDLLIHVRLGADNFDSYECDAPKTLGINILNLHKIVKTISSHDTVTFWFQESEEAPRLGLTIENEDKQTCTHYRINTLDLPIDDITIPDVEVDTVVSLRSNDFQRMIRDMTQLAPWVHLCACSEQIEFRCQGEYADRQTIVSKSEHGLVFSKPLETPIEGIFSLKHLNMFTKASNLSNNVDLFLKTDFPLILRYSVVDLGEIRFALTPKSFDSDGE